MIYISEIANQKHFFNIFNEMWQIDRKKFHDKGSYVENFPSIDNVKPTAGGRLNGTGVSEIRLSRRLRRPNNAYRADCGRSETSFHHDPRGSSAGAVMCISKYKRNYVYPANME